MVFGVFDFLQKTNKNKSTWGIIVCSKVEFFRSFFGGNRRHQKPFRNYLTFREHTQMQGFKKCKNGFSKLNKCNAIFVKKKLSIWYCFGITDMFLILMKTCCYTFLHCILKDYWSLNFGQEGYDKIGTLLITKFPES